MCCKSHVEPLDRTLAETILAVALFQGEGLNTWVRSIPEENCRVMATMQGGQLEVFLSPAVSQYHQHAEKRIAASVMFEVLSKYAEKVDGVITQKANVQGCTEGGMASHVIASYPSQPIMWEKVCPGFREVFMGTAEG